MVRLLLRPLMRLSVRHGLPNACCRHRYHRREGPSVVWLRPLSLRVTRPTAGSISSLSSEPDHSLVDERNAPAFWRGDQKQPRFPSPCPTPTPAAVYREMVSKEEADVIATEILGNRMKRRRYEKGHWDSVITGYKEVELHDIHQLLEENGSSDGGSIGDIGEHEQNESVGPEAIIARAFGRIRQHLSQRHLVDVDRSPIKWLPCHVIDLQKKGELKAHVDSVRFSGHLVAGLSLLSPAIMRLRHPPPPDEDEGEEQETSKRDEASSPGYVDLFLPPRSLYVLSGVGRYECSHEILPDASTFCGGTVNSSEPIVVSRDQRLSIIFRDAK
jgi:alkylated DNA repair protein alkB family protein 7